MILRRTLFAIALPTSMLLCGCHDKSGTAQAEFNDSQLTTHFDISDAEPEPVIEVQKPDSVPSSAITTAQDALDFMDNSPYADRYAQGILRTMARDNLPYTEKLLHNRHNYFIIVDKPSMYVVLYDRFGREKAAYRMACSKNYGTKHARRDNRTPEGFFTAEGVYNSTEWLYTDDDGNTSPVKGQFGPRFIRLQTDVSRQIGIHGTCAPWALGRRASHGCIRIHNDNILELVKYVEAGTPIIVNPSERDNRVNIEEGSPVPKVNIGKVTKVQKPAEPEQKPSTDANAAETIQPAPQPVEEADTLPTTMPF